MYRAIRLNPLLHINIAVFFTMLLPGCTVGSDTDSTDQAIPWAQHDELVTKVITGSAETPDPILVKVRELERGGVLKNVRVMESFPVQIAVTGPGKVIEKLEKMPRKIAPEPY